MNRLGRDGGDGDLCQGRRYPGGSGDHISYRQAALLSADGAYDRRLFQAEHPPSDRCLTERRSIRRWCSLRRRAMRRLRQAFRPTPPTASPRATELVRSRRASHCDHRSRPFSPLAASQATLLVRGSGGWISAVFAPSASMALTHGAARWRLLSAGANLKSEKPKKEKWNKIFRIDKIWNRCFIAEAAGATACKIPRRRSWQQPNPGPQPEPGL